MLMNVNQTYCSDCFAGDINIESLHSTPETNIMLYVDYISILKRKQEWLNTGGSMVKNLPAIQEAQVQRLGQEDSLEEGMPTHSSILA